MKYAGLILKTVLISPSMILCQLFHKSGLLNYRNMTEAFGAIEKAKN